MCKTILVDPATCHCYGSGFVPRTCSSSEHVMALMVGSYFSLQVDIGSVWFVFASAGVLYFS